MKDSNRMERAPEGDVVTAMLWMLILSLLLFWLPFIGPLIAGIVGGKKAGDVPTAIMAVFLPVILLGGAFFMLGSTLTGFFLIGAIAGLMGAGLMIVVLEMIPLLLGAAIGGLLAGGRR